MKYWCYLIFLSFFIFLFVSCEKQTSKLGQLENYIPENVSVTFIIPDFETLKNDVKNNSLISQLKNSSYYSFFSDNTFLKNFQTNQKCLLSIKNKHFIIITKQDSSFCKLNSITQKKIKKHTYKKSIIKEWKKDSSSYFSSETDSILLISSSKNLISEVLDYQIETNYQFKKILKNNNYNQFKVIAKTPPLKINDNSIDFANWTSVNMDILPNQIKATGVVLTHDSIPQLLSVFKGIIPQQNEISKITPLDAQQVIAFTYDDFGVFKNNLSRFSKKVITNNNQNLFESVSEVGVLTFSKNKAVVLKSINPDFTREELSNYINNSNNFKETAIYSFSQNTLFTDTFFPLITTVSPNYFFKIDNFLVFTETKTIAEKMITAYKNNNCINNTNYFKETNTQLSDASSLLILQLNGTITKLIAPIIDSENKEALADVQIKKYPLSVLQFSYDQNFAHLNWIAQEVSKSTQISRSVSQILELKLDTLLISEPQFFTNHRSKGNDIVVQDVTDTLHLISTSGKTLWKKKLDGPILGKINEVDLLKNGKKQLAFCTKNTFYILDRNGKEVAPFPKKFNDEITQPLAVFDYDKKRNYRFLITQSKELLMLDSKAKTVKGFTFKKTKSPIVLSPQHIRMGTKDYILIAEKDGKLHILNRTGKSRISVNKKFKFSEIPIANEAKNFVVITKDHTKYSISQTGKIIPKKLNVSNSYWFTINGSTKATLDDNLLRINGKLVELPFGMYTPPQIYVINRKTYVTVTEKQENKVFIFSKFGELLPNFPVFGTNKAQLNKIKNHKKMAVLVRSSPNSFVLYELQ